MVVLVVLVGYMVDSESWGLCDILGMAGRKGIQYYILSVHSKIHNQSFVADRSLSFVRLQQRQLDASS